MTLDELKAAGLRVKPLVWEDYQSESYSVGWFGTELTAYSGGYGNRDRTAISHHKTLASALAACELDHATDIAEALESL
jgi:hypothetical protein